MANLEADLVFTGIRLLVLRAAVPAFDELFCFGFLFSQQRLILSKQAEQPPPTR